MSAVEVVQRQLEAYNLQDLEAFCACFAEDCMIADLNGAVTQQGISGIRARYEQMFAQYPENRAVILNRIAIGDIVIDHEDIARSASERFQAVAIYTVRDGRISRVDFAR